MKYILIALVTFATFPSIADSTLPPQKISSVATGWSGEAIYITFENGNSAENCSTTNIAVPATQPMLHQIMSIALSAYHSGKRVKFRASGCFNDHIKGIAIEVVE